MRSGAERDCGPVTTSGRVESGVLAEWRAVTRGRDRAALVAMPVLICGVLLTGCADCLGERELESDLKGQLSIGAPRAVVERALAGTGLNWTYTDFMRRYNTTVRDPERCGQWVALSVYIHLDESERLRDVEVFRSYTMP